MVSIGSCINIISISLSSSHGNYSIYDTIHFYLSLFTSGMDIRVYVCEFFSWIFGGQIFESKKKMLINSSTSTLMHIKIIVSFWTEIVWLKCVWLFFLVFFSLIECIKSGSHLYAVCVRNYITYMYVCACVTIHYDGRWLIKPKWKRQPIQTDKMILKITNSCLWK